MKFHILRLLYGLLLFAIPITCAVNDNTKRHFSVQSECDTGPKSFDLDKLLGSVIKLCDQARTALTSIVNVNSFPNDSEQQKYMRAAHLIYGTPYIGPYDGGMPGEYHDYLNEISGNYNDLKGLISGDNALSPDLNLIVCDPTKYKLVFTMQDIDNSALGRLIYKEGTKDNEIRENYGLDSMFILPSTRGSDGIVRALVDTDEPSKAKYDVCAGESGPLNAFVTKAKRSDGFLLDFEIQQIVLCPSLTEEMYFDPDELDVGHDDPQGIPPYNGGAPSNFLDSYQSQAGVLLHELYHVLKPENKDWPFIDNVFGGTKKPYDIVNLWTIANYPDEISAAGKIKPEAKNLPDAYKAFAEATYILKDWGRLENGFVFPQKHKRNAGDESWEKAKL